MGKRENLRVEPRWRMTPPRFLDSVASVIGGGNGIFGWLVRCEFVISRRTFAHLSTSSLLWRKEARCDYQLPAYFVSSTERGWPFGRIRLILFKWRAVHQCPSGTTGVCQIVSSSSSCKRKWSLADLFK